MHYNNYKKKYIYIEEGKQLIWENLPKDYHRRQIAPVFNVILKEKGNKELCVQKWYWPNGARSFFSFRADLDAGNEESLSCFLQTIAPWAQSLSFFVCGKAYTGKEQLLQKVADLKTEVGNHTYTHYVFASKSRNRINLELTEKLLATVKIIPKGYVGPASFFHTSMYDVLEEKGYEYTSSFGLSHDDFPFYPTKNRAEEYRMVEIPFHCVGDRFPKFGMELDSEEVGSFFEQLLEKKYHLCEPMFIYGHPDMLGRMGDHPELVKRICKKALSFDDVCTGNMADIADWWRVRHNTSADIIHNQKDNVVIATEYCGSSDVYWGIQVEDGCKYLVSGEDLQEGVKLDELEKYKKIDLTISPYSNIGEVFDLPAEKVSLRSKLANWHRDLRRKRRMIRELRTASLRMKG